MMAKITIQHKGHFKSTNQFLSRAKSRQYLAMLDKYGKDGVDALVAATPVDSSRTALSWKYQIYQTKSGVTISWTNDNIVDGVPIAIIIQYGHGTRNGGYVQGIDYINPALKPIFDKILNDSWREVNA